MDISDTLSIEEFIKAISDAVVGKLGKPQKITAFFKTLKEVLGYLETYPQKVVLAIDE